MEASYPAVHPVGVPPQFKGAGPPATRMKDLPGSAGTLGGMGIRFGQFAFALTSFSVMITIPDFSSVTAFWYVSSCPPKASHLNADLQVSLWNPLPVKLPLGWSDSDHTGWRETAYAKQPSKVPIASAVIERECWTPLSNLVSELVLDNASLGCCYLVWLFLVSAKDPHVRSFVIVVSVGHPGCALSFTHHENLFWTMYFLSCYLACTFFLSLHRIHMELLQWSLFVCLGRSLGGYFLFILRCSVWVNINWRFKRRPKARDSVSIATTELDMLGHQQLWAICLLGAVFLLQPWCFNACGVSPWGFWMDMQSFQGNASTTLSLSAFLWLVTG